MSYRSIVEKKFIVTEQIWVVSLINTGSIFTGHSMILLEGLENGQPLIRQCDIKAIPLEEETEQSIGAPLRNVKGKITDIRTFTDYDRNKEKYQKNARSWYVTPTEAKRMLEDIQKDKDRTEAAKQGQGEYISYQYAGRESFWSNDNAHNCPSWCYEKLEKADVKIAPLPLDKFGKQKPQKHVSSCAEPAENTITSSACHII
jgi:hypothetical protein